MPRQHPARRKATDAVRRAVAALRSCGIRVPRFTLTTEWPSLIGGSWVDAGSRPLHLNMGCYPVHFMREWFAMHELGHVLWACHRPLRRKAFRAAFGQATPRDYHEIHRREAWKTASTLRLSWWPGPHRPAGQPSHYGMTAGGEERFCELIALMHAHGGFAQQPPGDLDDLWRICWSDGLARMV